MCYNVWFFFSDKFMGTAELVRSSALKLVLCCFGSTTTLFHHHHRYLNKRQINPFGKNRREKRSWFFIKLPSPWQKATMTMLLWL